ncbi:hypothetical protein L7F22_060184 [Adiantum nelumboides]|nr:hypothetical protein [Adiantum nelumboides]
MLGSFLDRSATRGPPAWKQETWGLSWRGRTLNAPRGAMARFLCKSKGAGNFLHSSGTALACRSCVRAGRQQGMFDDKEGPSTSPFSGGMANRSKYIWRFVAGLEFCYREGKKGMNWSAQGWRVQRFDFESTAELDEGGSSSDAEWYDSQELQGGCTTAPAWRARLLVMDAVSSIAATDCWAALATVAGAATYLFDAASNAATAVKYYQFSREQASGQGEVQDQVGQAIDARGAFVVVVSLMAVAHLTNLVIFCTTLHGPLRTHPVAAAFFLPLIHLKRLAHLLARTLSVHGFKDTTSPHAASLYSILAAALETGPQLIFQYAVFHVVGSNCGSPRCPLPKVLLISISGSLMSGAYNGGVAVASLLMQQVAAEEDCRPSVKMSTRVAMGFAAGTHILCALVVRSFAFALIVTGAPTLHIVLYASTAFVVPCVLFWAFDTAAPPLDITEATSKTAERSIKASITRQGKKLLLAVANGHVSLSLGPLYPLARNAYGRGLRGRAGFHGILTLAIMAHLALDLGGILFIYKAAFYEPSNGADNYPPPCTIAHDDKFLPCKLFLVLLSVANPYQELRQLLKDKPSSMKKGHAPHERSPSKEREGSESQDESMEDVAPRRRRAQRSPTPPKRKRSPHNPNRHESKREEKSSKKKKERKRSLSSSPSSSFDESSGYSSQGKQRRGHRRSYAPWKRSSKLKKFQEGGKNISFLTYDGTFGATDKVLAFIQQFDAAFRDEGFTESSKLCHVALHFQKSARQWWASLRANEEVPKTWKALRASIMKQFLASDAKDKILTEWRSLKLTPYESIHKQEYKRKSSSQISSKSNSNNNKAKKRRLSKNPYQELRQLLKDKPSSMKKGHAPHERSPSKEREGSESQDESMEDVAPRRRRAQRSPTPPKRKRSPHSPNRHESKREEKSSKKKKERKRSLSSSPSSSFDESSGYSSQGKQRRGHRRSYAPWKRSSKLKKFQEGGKNISFLTYDGTFGATDKVLAFIQQFDAAFRDEGFTESSKLCHVALHFQKSARQWWASLRANEEAPKTWKALRASIMKQFLASDAKDKILTEWRSLKLTPYESIHKQEYKRKSSSQISSKSNSNNNKAKKRRLSKLRASMVEAPKEEVHCTGSPLSYAWEKVREHDAFILFDPGSTHNFISLELVAKLRVQDFEMRDAMKMDGTFIGQVSSLILQLRLLIQGYVDKEDFFISPLKHEDVILGAPWFDQLTTSIKFLGRKISFKFREKDMYINA